MPPQTGTEVCVNTFVPQTGQGNAEYRLAAKLEADSVTFSSALPPGVQLLVGITPVPKSFALPNYAQRQRQMLAEWARWLKADAALVELPATMADENFASTTHLNEAGARIYTELLARALKSVWK